MLLTTFTRSQALERSQFGRPAMGLILSKLMLYALLLGLSGKSFSSGSVPTTSRERTEVRSFAGRPRQYLRVRRARAPAAWAPPAIAACRGDREFWLSSNRGLLLR